MTEMIFPQEKRDLKLTCTMRSEMLGHSVRYSFKLEQREKGKRKWKEIKEEDRQYRVNTAMANVLKYLSKDQVMELAELEHNKYAPTESLINE